MEEAEGWKAGSLPHVVQEREGRTMLELPVSILHQILASAEEIAFRHGRELEVHTDKLKYCGGVPTDTVA